MINTVRLDHYIGDVKRIDREQRSSGGSDADGVAYHSNLVVVVEACTNLTNPIWIPIQTNTISGGSSDLYDPHWTNFPSCYYRVRSP
jgi:hypothetical protein